MIDRFSPNWEQIKQPLNNIIDLLGVGDTHLAEAFKTASNISKNIHSAEEVKRELKLILRTSNKIPWVLFDTISNLIQSLPEPVGERIVQEFNIPSNSHILERLRPALDGRWQVIWEINNTGDFEDKYIALDWYIPPDKDTTPIVPHTIIDFIAGAVALVHSQSMLPAATLLMIALESSLWDGLVKKGISRESEQVTYSTIKWKFKRVADRLSLTCEETPDDNLSNMDTVMGRKPAEGEWELKKLYTDGGKTVLQLIVDDPVAGFIVSNNELKREMISSKGLSEAVQRARKESIIDVVPSQFDETIVKLRNNLIHLHSSGVLNPPIPALDGGREFSNLDELRHEPKLVKGLIPVIVEIINSIYLTS